MEWMYDGNKSEVNKEEYLLGKSVDKAFEGTLGQINAVEYDCTPASIFSSSADHQVDIERKIVEDPLVALRKRELETRKKLLDNPVKMKEINKYIEKMKKKKKKKDKKGYDDDEDEINRKLLKKLGGMKSGELSRSPSPKRTSSKYRSKSPESRIKNKRIAPRRRRSSSPKNSRRPRSISSPNRRQSPSYSRRRERSRSRNSYRRNKRERSHSYERTLDRDRRSRSPSPARIHKEKKSKDYIDQKKNTKISALEKEKKLQEMISNAAWRDDKRKENVKRSIEEGKKSSKEHEEYYNPDFIRKQLSKAAETGTVEKRLNANRHHVQKGADIMDTNFARK